MNMFKTHRLVYLIGFSLTFISVCRAQQPSVQRSWYGLEPAAELETKAKPYASAFFSKLGSLTRFGMAISDDNNECYFAVALNDNGLFREEIRVTRRQKDGNWTKPLPLLPEEKKYKYVDPHFSPDGKRMYFIYTKPADEKKLSNRQRFDIWYVQRDGNGWSDPVNVPSPISTPDANEYYVSLTSQLKIFFGSNRADGNNFDLYSASLGTDGRYQQPVPLPGKVNTRGYEADVFVAPDESYLIFCSSGRPDGFGQYDLYVSFKDSSGNWSEGKNLGERVNTKREEFAPSISRDQKALFFSSGGAIHWISTSVVEELRP